MKSWLLGIRDCFFLGRLEGLGSHFGEVSEASSVFWRLGVSQRAATIIMR
jgi:hypothetical protein